MSGPNHPPAGGVGSYLVSFAAVDIGVVAFTARPLVPVIELVFDSLAAPTDTIKVVPSKWVAEDLYVSDLATLQYPASITSTSALTDQPATGVAKKVRDNMTVSDNVTLDLARTNNYSQPVSDTVTAADSVDVNLTTGTSGAWVAAAGWTLSNSNRTAKITATSGANTSISADATIAIATSDYTFSVLVDALDTANTAPLSIGVTDGDYAAGGNLGADTHSAGCWANGYIVYNGFTVGPTIGALNPGDTVDVRVKSGNAYWRLNGGQWMGVSSTADPATDSGGVPLSFMTGGSCWPTAFGAFENTQVTATF